MSFQGRNNPPARWADIQRMLHPLRNRLMSVAARAWVRLVFRDTPMQRLQVEVLEGELKDRIEHFQPYGFTSAPLETMDAFVHFLGGDRAHGIVSVVADRATKGLQIDRREVRPELIPPLDDLSAALGKFELLLFAAGAVEPAGEGRYRIEIQQTGVLVEDQYDFSGFQFLGWWDINRHYVSNDPNEDHGDACPMSNLHFQAWRFLTDLGRDYMIYSDLRITNVDPPRVYHCFVPS